MATGPAVLMMAGPGCSGEPRFGGGVILMPNPEILS